MMENSMMVKAYLVYLIITIAMTCFVARILFQNSKVFMLDIFHGRAEIAYPTNRLFEIGFYLMNIGAALLCMQTSRIMTNQGLLETLSLKIGGFSIYLGIMLFLNLFLFFRGKKVSKQKALVYNTDEDDTDEDDTGEDDTDEYLV